MTHTAELTEAPIEDASNILVAPSVSHDDDTVRSPQRRTRGIPSPIHAMISRWISLLPPPKVKITADR